MGGIFGGPEMPEVTPPTDEQAKAAAKAEAERLRKRRGFASTILTSQQGVPGEPVTKKTILGG